MSEGWFVHAVMLKFIWFLLKLCNINVGGVNYRTSGMLEFG